jgi:hypothetical protein
MSLYLQISGHKPRHAGSGLSILTALNGKGKLKILITDIDLLDKEVPGTQVESHKDGLCCDILNKRQAHRV